MHKDQSCLDLPITQRLVNPTGIVRYFKSSNVHSIAQVHPGLLGSIKILPISSTNAKKTDICTDLTLSWAEGERRPTVTRRRAISGPFGSELLPDTPFFRNHNVFLSHSRPRDQFSKQSSTL